MASPLGPAVLCLPLVEALAALSRDFHLAVSCWAGCFKQASVGQAILCLLSASNRVMTSGLNGLYGLYGLVGLILAGIAALRPRAFWPLLVFAAVIGTGPMVEQYALADEYWLGCILLGAFLVMCLRGLRARSARHNVHYVAFSALMFYATVQSFVGWGVLGDWREVRFVAFFAMLWVLSYLLVTGQVPTPSPDRLMSVTFTIGTLYLVVYAATGLLFELLVGPQTRFDLQGLLWTGTTLAVIPVYLALPIAFLHVNERALKTWKGLLLLGLVVVVAVYYESRISYYALVLFGLASFSLKRMFRWVALALLLCAAVAWILPVFWKGHTAEELTSGLVQTAKGGLAGPADTRESDEPRMLEVLAAFRFLEDKPLLALVGNGVYTHKSTIVRYYDELASLYRLPPTGAEIRRSATFPSLVMDLGLVGVFLFSCCFLFAGLEIIARTRAGTQGRRLWLLSLFFLLVSMFISVGYDLVLLYVCIMPAGLLARLSNADFARTGAKPCVR